MDYKAKGHLLVLIANEVCLSALLSPCWTDSARSDHICAALLIIVMSESSSGYKHLHVKVLKVTTLGALTKKQYIQLYY